MRCHNSFVPYGSIYDNMDYCNFKQGGFIRPCNPCVGGGWNNWSNCCPPSFPEPCFNQFFGCDHFGHEKRCCQRNQGGCRQNSNGPFVFFYFPFR